MPKKQVVANLPWENMPDWAYLVVKTLLQALRERDPYTYGHCRRVSRNARLLAQAAGLSDEQQRVIEVSSVFHDIGKMGIPDSVLLKPGRLTEEEESLMREHPVKSADIISPLAAIPFFNACLPGIRHHHERFDGRGYPDGVMGDQIPLAARIILIADTFDAMTNDRPYRKAMTKRAAFKEIRKCAGKQFDPKVVDSFFKMTVGKKVAQVA